MADILICHGKYQWISPVASRKLLRLKGKKMLDFIFGSA
jgi:hypothetical protein